MTTALLISAASGCAVNPVTGKSELTLVSESSELELGRSHYLPTQQMQGGPYVVDKELTRYVVGVGKKIAKFSDRPNLPYEFVVLNHSTPNAWALPAGKIGLNRGLLVELKNEAELASVLAHEIVHAAARHTAKAMERAMVLQAGVLAAGVAAKGSTYADALGTAANVGATLVNQTYSRGAELEADRYGMRYMSKAGYDPRAAVTLQETFVKLSEGRRQDWLSGMFASHPPSRERVNANRATAAALPAGGVLGERAYAAAVRRLKKRQPAYDNADEARKKLQEGQPREALALAKKAVSAEPAEADFFAVRGQAYEDLGRDKDALADYSRAYKLNDRFFFYPLLRGALREQTGDVTGARSDLKASLKLLPTAPGYYYLGNAERKAGNVGDAKTHYAKAARSNSEYGQRARAALEELSRR